MCRFRYVVDGAITALLLAFLVTMDSGMAEAKVLTAKDLLTTMTDEQQYLYISGVIAGLGTARYVRDGNDTGSACIDRWFYDTEGVKDKIYAAFARFGDRTPSAILYALTAKECGK